MAYQVGIDPGTTSTVAAVCRADGAAQVVPLEGPTGAVVSAVHLGADGSLRVGEAAARRALTEPGRVVRDLLRRVGDDTPLLVGHEPVPPAEPAARFLARLVDDVARREGGVASRVAVTHPGSWGAHRVGSLRAALAGQGLGSAVLVPAPVAAVRAVPGLPGGLVGVYDLGGARFEAAVVRDGALAGPPEEIDRFGGADLDELVFAHVRTALGSAWDELDPAAPDVLAAVADLRRECTAAKEALSRDTEVHVPVALPGLRTQVRLGRAEFEEMIRPGVLETVEALRRALDAAGTSPARLAALVVVGGSAHVPLVPQLLGEAFGREVTVAADPVAAVATGAALLVGRPDAGAGAGRERRAPAGGARRAAPSPVAARAVAGAAASGVLEAAGAGADRPSPAPVSTPGAPPRAAGPGTAPLAGAPAAPAETTVLPPARPPKQARPFTAVPPTPPSRTGRLVLVGSAAALAVAVLGGVVAFGVGRIGAGQEAGAVTPASVVGTSAPAPSVVLPVEPPPDTATPARPAAPPARRSRPAAPPPPASSAAPRATSAAPATTAPPTAPPAATEEETTAPAPPTGEPAANQPDAGGKGSGEANAAAAGSTDTPAAAAAADAGPGDAAPPAKGAGEDS